MLIYLFYVFITVYQIIDFLFVTYKDCLFYKVTFQEYLKRFAIFLPRNNYDFIFYGVSCGETKLFDYFIDYLKERNKHKKRMMGMKELMQSKQ